MKKQNIITVLGTLSAIVTLGTLILSGCGGGGGGGGASKQTTNLYLFGTMSSSGVINGVATTVSVPNFKDYTTASTTTPISRDLRTGTLVLSSKGTAVSVAKYDAVAKILTINMTFNNLSSSTSSNAGKGNIIATLVTTPGTTFPAQDASPTVAQFRSSPIAVGNLNGCKVNYAP
jgi:hypothetical protein